MVGFVQEIISNCFPTSDFETDFATTDMMVTLPALVVGHSFYWQIKKVLYQETE